jgi:cell division protein FtsB
MEYLKKRQKNRKRLYSKVTIAGLLLVFLFLLHPTWKIFRKSMESKENLEQAQTELSELESRRTALARDVAYLETEGGRDQEIRNKFGVTKEGETMVVIVRKDRPAASLEPVSEPHVWERAWSGILSVFGID